MSSYNDQNIAGSNFTPKDGTWDSKVVSDNLVKIKTQSKRHKFIELSSDGQDRMTRQRQRLQRLLSARGDKN